MPNPAYNDTAVQLTHVSKTFTQVQHDGGLSSLFRPEKKVVHALNDVSLRIQKGEFAAYAGPNGAGKSTTFKLLCGLLSPSSGAVQTLGLDPMRDRIALMGRTGVFFGGRTELWWDHPVISSFKWKKKVWDVPDDVYERQFALACEYLDLKPLLHTFARELSLGQKLRCDLGLLLLHDPELLLLDEPTLGLDVLAKRQMIDFLKALNREKSTTILVTSHDLDDLTEMASRLLLISNGAIAFDGDLPRLRQMLGDERLLTLTRPGPAPDLYGAAHVSSEGDRHTYVFQGPTDLPQLMQQAYALPDLLDVELGRPPIEQQIAQLYAHWQNR